MDQLLDWLEHSIQVKNAEPEHFNVEGEERNAKEARCITFAGIGDDVHASPHFLAKIVLFSRVHHQNILVCRYVVVCHHWCRGLVQLLRASTSCGRVEFSTWVNLVAGCACIGVFPITNMISLSLGGHFLAPLSRWRFSYHWRLDTSFGGDDGLLVANWSRLCCFTATILILLLSGWLADFVLERICPWKAGRRGHKVRNREHEVENGSSDILIEIFGGQACPEEREVYKHQDFLQTSVVLKEQLSKWQVSKHNSVCFACKFVKLRKCLVKRSVALGMKLMAKVAQHQIWNWLLRSWNSQLSNVLLFFFSNTITITGGIGRRIGERFIWWKRKFEAAASSIFVVFLILWSIRLGRVCIKIGTWQQTFRLILEHI